ncbi:MAG: hypothetical protein AAGJ10_09485 [Bacteroidota bacterium]
MPTLASAPTATPLATTTASTSNRFSLRAWFNRTFVVDFSGIADIDLGEPMEFEAHVAELFTPGSYASAE